MPTGANAPTTTIDAIAERAEAHFPPAARVVTVEGTAATLTDVVGLLRAPDPVEILGPVPLPGVTLAGTEDAIERLTLRTPQASGSALVQAITDVTAVRSAKKSEGALRVRVDPAALG